MRFILTTLFGFTCLSFVAQSPCIQDSNYRTFDFWIGEWDVYNENELAGTNDVSLILDSCVIMENWKSAKTQYKGKSFNYYENDNKTWHQTWVDNQGKSLLFSGKFNSDRLTYEGISKGPEGQKIYHKMVFVKNDDGSVRQHWQRSTDNENWKTVFDGHYIPRGHKIEDYTTE